MQGTANSGIHKINVFAVGRRAGAGCACIPCEITARARARIQNLMVKTASCK